MGIESLANPTIEERRNSLTVDECLRYFGHHIYGIPIGAMFKEDPKLKTELYECWFCLGTFALHGSEVAYPTGIKYEGRELNRIWRPNDILPYPKG